ncbi:chromosome transmission fidelity 4 protein [Rutstroemia sp. NJR-2017a BVV2]|nr:chromosome transmission fidelity 4 protein [Rutstroemia sp. NJR-2017a BVV2]PQE18594.1 chromosome transmission fidelity 4 protein [Rutstroemia sp. NJR-2017a BVV2]
MSTSFNLVRAAPKRLKLSSSCPIPSICSAEHPLIYTTSRKDSRYLATVSSASRILPDVWFTGSAPHSNISPREPHNQNSGKPPDERTLKLGKTLRILQERLPTLLQSPLPQEILSPQITLHLFPSTHPHLPTVSGRVAYSAALWTSPIAWGRVPIVGNVRLEILSERIQKTSRASSASSVSRPEQLIVRWRTIGKTKNRGTGGFYKGIGAKDNVDKITEWLGGGSGEDDSKEFTGLFIFEFDEEGRIVSHTIEHVQEGGNWERGVGAKVVGLTDWLLGGMRNGNGNDGAPCPAFWVDEGEEGRRR